MDSTSTKYKISITGDLGSGKSVIGRLLAQELGIKFYSTGGIQREIASRYNIDTLELNKRSENNFEFDREIDAVTKGLNAGSESFVIDSRMAWYFIPNSFKIYLKVDADTAVKRIFSDESRKNEDYPDISSAKSDIARRRQSELHRFKKYYQVECDNMGHYDLVIDTSFSTPPEIADTILTNLPGRAKPGHRHKYWLPPRLLYPAKDPGELAQPAAKRLAETVKKDGYDNRSSVEVVAEGEFFYIYDGHKRVSAALLNEISLIPIDMKAANQQEIKPGLPVREFIEKNVDRARITAWENYHRFRFSTYP